jgi:hypothetical protein
VSQPRGGGPEQAIERAVLAEIGDAGDIARQPLSRTEALLLKILVEFRIARIQRPQNPEEPLFDEARLRREKAY